MFVHEEPTFHMNGSSGGAWPGTGGITTGMLGDVDGDGEVTEADAQLANQIAVNPSAYSEGQRRRANVTEGDTVTARDALLIARFASGQISQFPRQSSGGDSTGGGGGSGGGGSNGGGGGGGDTSGGFTGDPSGGNGNCPPGKIEVYGACVGLRDGDGNGSGGNGGGGGDNFIPPDGGGGSGGGGAQMDLLPLLALGGAIWYFFIQ